MVILSAGMHTLQVANGDSSRANDRLRMEPGGSKFERDREPDGAWIRPLRFESIVPFIAFCVRLKVIRLTWQMAVQSYLEPRFQDGMVRTSPTEQTVLTVIAA